MSNFIYYTQDKIADFLEWLKYDFLRLSLPNSPKFPDHIQLKIITEKNGYWVTSPDYPGFIASGDTLDELREAIFDNMLLYLDFPRAKARRLVDNISLDLSDGRQVLPKDQLFVNSRAVATN